MSDAPKPDSGTVERFRAVMLPHLDAAHGFARRLRRVDEGPARLAPRQFSLAHQTVEDGHDGLKFLRLQVVCAPIYQENGNTCIRKPSSLDEFSRIIRLICEY